MQKLVKHRFDPKQDRLFVTYVGILKTFDDLGKQVLRESTDTRSNGYGHLNTFPVELIVKDVRDPLIEHVGKGETSGSQKIKEVR